MDKASSHPSKGSKVTWARRLPVSVLDQIPEGGEASPPISALKEILSREMTFLGFLFGS